MGIKHSKVSNVQDFGSERDDLVRPSDWNRDHTIDGNVSFGNHSITNVNLVDGYDVSAMGDKLAGLPTSAIQDVGGAGTTSTPARGRINFTGAAVVSDNSGTNSKDVAITGYSMQFMSSTGNPADATTYFIGASGVTITGVTASGPLRVYVPKAGTIKAAYGNLGVGGVLGTTETSTVALRLNNTTDTNLTTTLQANAASNPFSSTGLSIAVVAGDYLEIKVTTPTWTTNPTNAVLNVVLYIE